MSLKNGRWYSSGIFKRLSYRDLIIFLIPFIVFIGYLYIYNPGIVRYDSFNQLHQIATSTFTNWHPFFHTFIEMLCLKVYPDTKSIAVFQIVTFSVMWAVICNYFRNGDENNKGFILQVLFTALISLIPINAVFSITLLKDILFSYFLLFACFLVKVLLDRKGDVGYGFIILMSLTLAFVAQIRPNGIYIVLMFLLILAIYLFRNYNVRKLHVLIPAFTVIFILLIASLNVVYDVEDNQKDAAYAKTIHMLADYDLNLDLSSQDRDKIHEVINESYIRQKYVQTGSDNVYNGANQSVYDSDKFAYITLAIKYSLKNPLYFLHYIFESSPMVWDIVRGDDWEGTAYSTGTNQARDTFYSRNYYGPPAAAYDNVTSKNKGTVAYDKLNSFVKDVKHNKLTDTLFDSPALYMYLSFILMGGIWLLTRSKDILMVYALNMLNILTIFVSTPTQDCRYLYPNLLLFYLLVIILIGILTRPDFEFKISSLRK